MTSDDESDTPPPPPPPPYDLVDVFCGGGLYSFGARTAGMRVVAAVDNSADALRVYKSNFTSPVSCAEVGPGCTTFAFPAPRERLHVHFSPPCQELSNAKRGPRSESGLEMLRWSVEMGTKYDSFSLETVHTSATLALAKAQTAANPTRVVYGVYDAVNFGAAQTRVRLIIATPAIIRRLNEAPASARVSVEDAFRAARVALPAGATHVRNSSPSKEGSNIRPIQGPAFTCCASRALTFSNAAGQTVLSMRPEHTRVLMGLPSAFQLSGKQCVDQPVLGNGVVFGLARAIALAAMGREITPLTPPPPPSPLPPPLAAVASKKRGRTGAAEAGGDGSSGSFGCGECRALKAKLQRAERRIALLSELAALGGGDVDAD